MGPTNRSEDHGYANDAHGAAEALWSCRVGKNGHADGHDHPAAEALQTSKGDQRRRRPRHAGQHRTDKKQRDGGHVHALGPEAVGGPPGQRHNCGERKHVSSRYPLNRREG